MNPETGRIYYGEEEVGAAKARGEPLIELSEKIAEPLNVQPPTRGEVALNRAQRRAQRFGGARGRPWERR